MIALPVLESSENTSEWQMPSSKSLKKQENLLSCSPSANGGGYVNSSRYHPILRILMAFIVSLSRVKFGCKLKQSTHR